MYIEHNSYRMKGLMVLAAGMLQLEERIISDLQIVTA